MPDTPLFVIGQRYRRRALHERLGGQRQGGISTPHDHPIVMLFKGESGEQYGYRDGVQPDGMFWYTGEGQVGDMQVVRGNRAIRDHKTNGRSLHLFEQLGAGWVR
jgi:5-methylcytosine-specific restriction enzyme A